MNSNSVVISGKANFGVDGLGQHLAQIVQETGQKGELNCYFCYNNATQTSKGHTVELPLFSNLVSYTPLRFSQKWRYFTGIVMYDMKVACLLPKAEVFHSFASHSLWGFRRARQLGYKKLVLEAATSHAYNLRDQHSKAEKTSKIEPTFVNPIYVHRLIKEYKLADEIFVASDYTYESFLAGGVEKEKLRKRKLSISPRFKPVSERPRNSRFEIVYVGRLSQDKGIPLLLEAFQKFDHKDARLTLIGHSSSRAMHSYLKRATAQNNNITWTSGDPLPYLQKSDLFIHPSFEDGFALAPKESLACGTPVIVTEDTGMKSYVRNGINGFVVPTGNSDAIVEKINSIYDQPLAGTF